MAHLPSRNVARARKQLPNRTTPAPEETTENKMAFTATTGISSGDRLGEEEFNNVSSFVPLVQCTKSRNEGVGHETKTNSTSAESQSKDDIILTIDDLRRARPFFEAERSWRDEFPRLTKRKMMKCRDAEEDAIDELIYGSSNKLHFGRHVREGI